MKNFLFAILTSALIMGETLAIEPVYEGDDGIKAQVFDTNCLSCHSSELSGGDRNGAPSGVDYDSYATAVTHGGGAVKRGVTDMNMPPASSPKPPLTEEQKMALSNWKALGFPEKTMPPVYSAVPRTLTLPVAYLKDENGEISQKVQAVLTLVGGTFEITELEDVEEAVEKDEHGCVAPATWHEAMGHCMVQ